MGPQVAEPLAGKCELSDTLDAPAVAGVILDGCAKSGNEVRGRFPPLLLDGLFPRVEEEGTKPVLAGGERDGHGIGGQYAENVLDACGDLKVGEELVHPSRRDVGPARADAACGPVPSCRRAQPGDGL